ncbi:GTPase-activating protein [Sorochytrium milnesiophthora]
MSAPNESAFRSSLRNFQASAASQQTPAILGKINPQQWLQSMRTGGNDGDTASEGLLSGVRNLATGNRNDAAASSSSSSFANAFTLSTYQRFMAFLCCTAGGVICFMVSFFLLPMVPVVPQKFAFLSCMGSALTFSSIGFLRGWGGHLKSVFAAERWPFTVGYLGSMVGTLYSCLVVHSYLLTMLMIIVHLGALVWLDSTASIPGNGGSASPRASDKRSFWKIHVPKLPGSIRPVGGTDGANSGAAKVIGAQYTFGMAVGASPRGGGALAPLTSSVSAPVPTLSHPPGNSKAKGSGGGGTPHSFNQFINDTDADWGAGDDPTSATPTSQPANPHLLAAASLPASPARSANASPSRHGKSGSSAEADKQAANELLSLNARVAKYDKFKAALNSPNVDLATLRKLSWSGIPEDLRPTCWQLLMGYLPCNAERRAATLARKRKEYEDNVAQAYGRGESGLDQAVWHQIHIDVPRTNPTIPLYQQKCVQESLERVLYCWAMKHPASGYVQGINDLVTPFYTVFLAQHCDKADVYSFDTSQLPKETLTEVEADSFWCLTKLLDNIQDNYTFAQPGIQRQVTTLKDLVARIDAALSAHLEKEGVEFIQFAFRWMNCLLIRELTPKSVVRMWDTYMAEGTDGFSDFHVYVCTAFLVKWSQHLRTLDFQGILMFLQSAPTQTWEEKDIELLLSEAYMWKTMFFNSPNHLQPK